MRLGFFFAAAALVACGGGIATGNSDGGTTSDGSTPGDASTTKDGAPTTSCGTGCGPTQFCQLDKTCGNTTAGTCQSRPTGCTDIYEPVCGVDGKTYPSPCDANAAGVDITEKGGCPPPQGWVACGDHFCDATMYYCQVTGNDAPGPGQPCAYEQCQQLPPECKGQTSCSCFMANSPCQCTYAGGGFTLNCPGG